MKAEQKDKKRRRKKTGWVWVERGGRKLERWEVIMRLEENDWASKEEFEWNRKWRGKLKKEDDFLWVHILHRLGTLDGCSFIRLLKSFGMARCVYHSNGEHGNLRSDGELVGGTVRMDYHPMSSEAFRSKRFTLSNVSVRECAHVCVCVWERR